MTRIVDLPLLGFDMLVGTNEDWLDSWEYRHPATDEPLSLAGLTLTLAVTSPGLVVLASTATTVRGIAVNGGILVSGDDQNRLGLQVLRPFMLTVPAGAYDWEAQAQGDTHTRTIGRGRVTVQAGGVP